MTIDMLRHTSLRELVARALYDSPPPAGTWPVPAAAHGASFAVRNLPHDTDPERAVSLKWIALVCLHSGVFTRAQFCFYFEGARRNRASRFVRDLVDRRLAVDYALPNKRGRAKACRISNKEIYRKLGIENVRHRRDADDSVMLRRLLSLDYVPENPELPWLPTEQEQVAFLDLLGIDRRRLPHRVYLGAVGSQTRYFAMKLPIAADTKTAPFAYVDPGKDTDTELRSWDDSHEWLWRALRLKGIELRAIVIGADYKATIRAEAALKTWSSRAGEQSSQRSGQEDVDTNARTSAYSFLR